MTSPSRASRHFLSVLVIAVGLLVSGSTAAEFDAKSFGLVPNDKNAAIANREAFQRAAQAAGASPGNRLIVSGPPAVYYIQGGVVFASMSDLHLDFGSSTFVGTTNSALFVFVACKRFVVATFAVDWDPWTHTGGRVVKIDSRGRYFDLEVSPPYVAANSVNRPCLAYQEYYPHQNRMCESPCLDIYQMSYTSQLITAPDRRRPNVIRIPTERRDGQLRVNQHVLVRHAVYGNDAIAGYHIEDFTFHGIFIQQAPGMGIFCAGCRNIVVQWMSIFRTHDRWLSVSADGYHFGSHSGDLRIIHSNCDGTGDDCIGVGHLIHHVRSINGNSMRISTIVRAMGHWRVGDVLIFGKPGTPFQPYLTLPITRVQPDFQNLLWDVFFEGPVPPQVAVGDSVYVQTTGSLYVSNFVGSNNRARGAALALRNQTVFENCKFSGQHGEGIYLSTETTAFGMGPNHNFVIRNNVFENQGSNSILSSAFIAWGQDEPLGVNRGLIITGNTFLNPKGAPISVSSSSDVSISSNKFVSHRAQPAIEYCNVVNLIATGNTVQPAMRDPLRLRPNCSPAGSSNVQVSSAFA